MNLVAIAVTKEVEQIAVRHVFGDYIEWWLSRADAKQLNQIRMLHLFHKSCLSQKVL